MSDDWMYPQSTVTFTPAPPKDGTFYVIERKRRIPVSGSVSHIERWDTWAQFTDKKERDGELSRLRETTDWHLRGRVRTFLNGVETTRDPTEYMDF